MVRNHNKFFLDYTGDTVAVNFLAIGSANLTLIGELPKAVIEVKTFAVPAEEELAKQIAALLNEAYDRGWQRGREAVLEAFKEAVGMGE